MENITYYAIILLVLIVGFVVIKRIASCFIKAVVTIVLLVLLAAIYWIYLT